MKNIKIKSSGVKMRVSDNLVETLEKGSYTHTSKSALKKYWKQQDKIERNIEYLKNFDFSKKQKENFVVEEGNKTYAYLRRYNPLKGIQYQRFLINFN